MSFNPDKNMLRTNLITEKIPQLWDDVLQEFIPDEGKREVTPANKPSVTLIKEFTGVNHLVTVNYHHYGANDGVDVYTELDVSNYRELTIHINNQYDVDVNVFLHLSLTSGSGKRERVVLGTALAGQTRVFYPFDNPALVDLPVDYIGILTTSQAAATTGTADLGIYGR